MKVTELIGKGVGFIGRKVCEAKDWVIDNKEEIAITALNIGVGAYIGTICYGVGNVLGYAEGYGKGERHTVDLIQQTQPGRLPETK